MQILIFKKLYNQKNKYKNNDWIIENPIITIDNFLEKIKIGYFSI